MTEAGREPDAQDERAMPFLAPCNTLSLSAPVGWLRQGWLDYRAAPLQSLAYGFVIAVITWLTAGIAVHFGGSWLLLMALSGFVFLGPVLCLGLYAISAQLERNRPASLMSSFRESAKRRFGTEMIFALILLVVFLVWARAGSMVQVFFPTDGTPEPEDFIVFLGVGSAIGSIFAAITFAASAFSLPMIMHRNVDAPTGVITSINAVLRNKGPMLVWVALIIAGVVVGFATAGLGLILTIPVIGYATWHGYLETIDASGFPRHEKGVAAQPRNLSGL